MTRKHFITKLIAGLMACMCLTGCGGETVITETKPVSHEEVVEKVAMLDAPEIAYEVADMYSGILVDCLGYELGDKKQAVISAKMLPATFNLIDVESGESVYHGQVKKVKVTEDDGHLSGLCDFSDFDSEGTYYIETEIVGCSENFTISSDYYSLRLKEAFMLLEACKCNCDDTSVSLESDATVTHDVSGGFHTDGALNKDVVEGCLTVMDLLTTYEFNKKAYGDDMEIEMSGNKIPDIVDEAIYEAEWLLKMQNAATGGVYGYVSTDNNGNKVIVGETTNATAHFCAAMAKTAVVIRPYNPTLSKNCQTAASKAWKCLEANKTLVTEEQLFRAATEMYRLTGYTVYSTTIINFLRSVLDKDYTGRTVLDGVISYLGTAKYIDVDACNEMMAKFMSRTEDKATSASKSRLMVEAGERSPEELLRNAYELTLVDYVISSTEYTKLEKNYLHYLGGRNENSDIYFNNLSGPDAYAELIALTGALNNK